MSKMYRIVLTEEQMRVVGKCCEMYFRLMMGQDMEFSEEIAGLNTDFSPDNSQHDRIFNGYISRRDHIREIMKSVFRIAFEPTGFLSEKTEDMMIAECIWDAFRFARGKSRRGAPFHIGPEPTPIIQDVESKEDRIESKRTAQGRNKG